MRVFVGYCAMVARRLQAEPLAIKALRFVCCAVVALCCGFPRKLRVACDVACNAQLIHLFGGNLLQALGLFPSTKPS